MAVQTDDSQFAVRFAVATAQTSEEGTITDKIGKIIERAIANAQILLSDANSASPKSCDILLKERAKGLEPSTSSLGTNQHSKTTLENPTIFLILRQFAVQFAPDLAKVVAAWPELPTAIRRAILALERAGEGTRTLDIRRAIVSLVDAAK
jgi:hypothetical protein